MIAAALDEPLPVFDRLGGRPALAAAVEGLFSRVMQDPALAPFFIPGDLPWLQGSLTDFLAQLLGGPLDYKGGPMREAHAHLRLGGDHFTRFTSHLLDALAGAGVDAPLIGEVHAALLPLMPVIAAGEPD